MVGHSPVLERSDFGEGNMVYSAWKAEKAKLIEFLLCPGHYAIEIGSFCGGTSRALGLACKLLRKRLICIDPWQGEEGQDRFSRYQLNISDIMDSVITLKTTSCNALRLLPSDVKGDVCLVFVDGDHVYPQPLHDMTHYWPLLAQGGVMAIHDIFDEWWHGCVFRAVTEFFKDKPGYCLEAMNYIPYADEVTAARHHSSGLIWTYCGSRPRSARLLLRKLFARASLALATQR